MRAPSGSRARPAVSATAFHRPVLVAQCLELLDAAPGHLVVDATLGDGGHAEAILERTAPGGRLIGLDRDPDALRIAGARLAPLRRARDASCTPPSASSARCSRGSRSASVDGVLFDLGVSSRQLDAPARGFRFAEASAAATPLDMRMDPSAGETAAELLARASEAELERWLREYGELPGARRLARTLVERRRAQPLRTTADLLAASREARVGGGRRHHPATLVFQALRIAVNDELGALAEGLEAGDRGARAGRAPVRDRLPLARGPAREAHLRAGAARLRLPAEAARLPLRPAAAARARHAARGPRRRRTSCAENPRARSARLRAARRLAEAA